jgi:hypothetical protein
MKLVVTFFIFVSLPFVASQISGSLGCFNNLTVPASGAPVLMSWNRFDPHGMQYNVCNATSGTGPLCSMTLNDPTHHHLYLYNGGCTVTNLPSGSTAQFLVSTVMPNGTTINQTLPLVSGQQDLTNKNLPGGYYPSGTTTYHYFQVLPDGSGEGTKLTVRPPGFYCFLYFEWNAAGSRRRSGYDVSEWYTPIGMPIPLV